MGVQLLDGPSTKACRRRGRTAQGWLPQDNLKQPGPPPIALDRKPAKGREVVAIRERNDLLRTAKQLKADYPRKVSP